jgi:hypothetical protein
VDESIADPRHRLDELWRLGGILEGVPQPIDCIVEPVIEVEIYGRRPDLCAQLGARDHLSGAVDQSRQNAKGLNL